MNFSKLTKQSIRSLRPYEAKKIPCGIKLDANECPYSISDGVFAEKNFIGALNRYPDPEIKELRKVVAKNFRVSPDNILVGNGSDELIYYLIITFGGPVIYPAPTFSMYEIISRSLGEECIGIPLDRNFDLDMKKMSAAVEKYRPRLIFLNSPNNPTGNCFSDDRILKTIEALDSRTKGIVVVDEAYQPFSGKKGFLPLLKDYKNLAVLRTLSKVGFAALRVGFLVADKELITEVNKVRLPFNLNALSQSIALETFRNKEILDSWVSIIRAERERLFKELNNLNGVRPCHSEANFILFKVDAPDIVFQRLIKLDVLVRNLSSMIKGSLRVTVGTPEENNAFIKAIRTAMHSSDTL
ncbi:histidinol-phosphate transaminase [Thermodesulfovibrionales bacterium]|nr:histidinol-phosphate transaminase [Thermodesulfovibrionales bacterium]MCL0107163.1 histidinol-phosphate transaminase [Thermodesulfovibrionales bacterium]